MGQVGKKSVGKKKAKQKEKTSERPGRKDLTREVERLHAENDALRARLERIAEIASHTADSDASNLVLNVTPGVGS